MAAGVAVLKGGWHNPSLIDFPRDSLQPIWSFCTDAARRGAFEAEFEKRAKGRISIISGLSLYTPMYLYRNDTAKSYRLHPSANLDGSREAQGMAWKIQNDGKPLFNIAARQIEGTVPLYVYHHKTDHGVYRYEAGEVGNQYLNEHFNSCYWSRVSKTPLGFVLETAKLWGKLTPAEVCPVYAYVPADDFLVRYYYSLDEDDRTLEPDEGWQRYNYVKDSLRWAANEMRAGRNVKYLTTEAAAKQYAENFGTLETGMERPQWYAWLPV